MKFAIWLVSVATLAHWQLWQRNRQRLAKTRMKNQSHLACRRRFLLGAGASLGSFGILDPVATSAFGAGDDARLAAKIPFIHTTDLDSPPQDPDDHVDLATVFALPENLGSD